MSEYTHEKRIMQDYVQHINETYDAAASATRLNLDCSGLHCDHCIFNNCDDHACDNAFSSSVDDNIEILDATLAALRKWAGLEQAPQTTFGEDLMAYVNHIIVQKELQYPDRDMNFELSYLNGEWNYECDAYMRCSVCPFNETLGKCVQNNEKAPKMLKNWLKSPKIDIFKE